MDSCQERRLEATPRTDRLCSNRHNSQPSQGPFLFPKDSCPPLSPSDGAEPGFQAPAGSLISPRLPQGVNHDHRAGGAIPAPPLHSGVEDPVKLGPARPRRRQGQVRIVSRARGSTFGAQAPPGPAQWSARVRALGAVVPPPPRPTDPESVGGNSQTHPRLLCERTLSSMGLAAAL